MNFTFPKISFPFFERNIRGDSFYQVNNHGNWSNFSGTNLDIAENHPILTPALLFISKLTSQGVFYLKNKDTKAKNYNHWLLSLLERPNFYQTGLDFLESLAFIQIASGKAVVWLRRTTGSSIPTAMYLLNPDLIEYPDDFRTQLSKANESNVIKNKTILYDRDGENEEIPIRDLLFFYDLPNGIHTDNMFEVKSRMDGLKQTLINTNDSLLAKNIILKTNGKELITGNKNSTGSFPLSDQEKEDAEKLFFTSYGLGTNRRRGLLTKADLKWQSLHIALRDLGLDESVKVDGNLIYTALHIPKDILSLEAKKTTYNNFKESMVSYIQNEIQATMNSISAVFQPLLEDQGWKLTGSFEHLPIMQFILIERYEGVEQRGLALKSLRDAGLPDDVALDLCDFDASIKLKKLEEPKPNQNGNTGTSTSPKERRQRRENQKYLQNGQGETEEIEYEHIN